MLHYVSDLETYHLHATDGELGKVENWYVNDKSWVIQYAAVDTRKWLPGRKVLLSPSAFSRIDAEIEEVMIKHNKETVRDSPPLQENELLTNEYASTLNAYYGWDPYWSGAELWGQMNNPLADTLAARESEMPSDKIEEISNEKDYTLREVDEIINNAIIYVNHKRLGMIDDLLIDEENWKVRYLVIWNKDNGKEPDYFLSPDWIASMDWEEHTIEFNLPEEEIRKGARTRKKARIQREEEKEIYKRYYKAPYWE